MNSSAVYLRASEYARLYGMSVRTVRRMIARGELPVLRLGRQRRIDLEELGLSSWPNLPDLVPAGQLAGILRVDLEGLVALAGAPGGPPLLQLGGRWVVLRPALTRWLAQNTSGG